MLNSVKGLWLTLMSTVKGLHQPVTRNYPDTGNFWKRVDAPTPVQDRFMGFPALTWDSVIDEPYCTSCMVCIRNCPTQCMSSTMKDNPAQQEGRSHRRKIVDSFEINLNRCILCGICVDVCNFDAIVMSHEHELSAYQRNSARMDLPDLLKLGRKFQQETAWIPPTQRAKQAKEESAEESAESESGDELSPEEASGEP